MENQHQPKSSSSFTADLFGDTEPTPPSSSAGTFAAIFPPPSTVMRRYSTSSHLTGSLRNQRPGNQEWNTKQKSPDNAAKNGEGANNSLPNKERSSIFQERVEPCPLSSSIYYGGQEDISRKTRAMMIPMETIYTVLLEEIGGKGHFITKTLGSPDMWLPHIVNKDDAYLRFRECLSSWNIDESFQFAKQSVSHKPLGTV